MSADEIPVDCRCPLPIVEREYQEDDSYQDTMRECGSELVIEINRGIMLDTAGDFADESSPGWQLRCMDWGHVLLVPYDDGDGTGTPADDAITWVRRAIAFIRGGPDGTA